MTSNPVAAAWAPWLGDIVPELQAVFLDAVVAMERALGPLPPLPDPGAVEPTGLDGLTRRAPYERLLLSEWVLADEAPEEFLRRAATAEHLFHNLARSVPQRGRRCVVLLDSGPEQLGGPRLAQLALLVVFARRASRAGATLTWGSLQGTSRFDEAGLRAFVGLRSPAPATPDHFARWVRDLEPEATDELFVVGGPRAVRLARGWATVRLEQPVDVDEDVVRVTVARPGLAPVRRDLVLPEPAARTRWIRDPFRAPEVARSPPVRRSRQLAVGGTGPLLPFLRFSTDGNRILAVTRDERAVAYRVPEGADPVKRPLMLSRSDTRARVVAVGWSMGKLQAAFTSEQGPILHGGKAGYYVIQAELAPRVSDDEVGELFSWKEAPSTTTWIRTPDGAWYSMVEDGPAVRQEGVCLALARRDGHRAVVIAAPEGLHLRYPNGQHDNFPVGPVERAVVGSGYSLTMYGHVVAQSGQRGHSLLRTQTNMEFTLPRGRIVGAPLDRKDGIRRGVMWLDDGDLLLRWLPDSDVQQLASGVTAAAGGTMHYDPNVAWIEGESTVVLWDVVAGVERCRWTE